MVKKVKKAAAVVTALENYEMWAIAITSHAATRMPPSELTRMVRFNPLAEVIPDGYINPKLPNVFQGIAARKSRRITKLNDTIDDIIDSSEVAGDRNRNSLVFRVGELNRGGWKKWAIEDELERGKSPLWWTLEELRLMKIDNLVEMHDENLKGGWEEAAEEDSMVRCSNCERPIHPVHVLACLPGDEQCRAVAECARCFRVREKKFMPALKKRNLQHMLQSKREEEAMVKKEAAEMERLRSLPPPVPTLFERFLSLITGFDLSRVNSENDSEQGLLADEPTHNST